jgi:hypothetical protein
MKNFNDYFQAPLLIVNPYEKYEPKVNRRDQAPSFVCKPIYAEYLIPGIVNEVAFKLEGFGEGCKARLINTNNETISLLKPLFEGLGVVDLIPEEGVSYQVVIERASGDLSFHDFINLEGGSSGVKVVNRKGTTSIQLTDGHKLAITDAKGQSIAHTTLSLTSLIVSDTALKSPLYFVHKLGKDSSIIRSFPVFDKSGVEPERDSIYAGLEEELSLKYQLPQGSYAVSVRKVPVYQQSQSNRYIYDGLMANAPILGSANYSPIWKNGFDLSSFIQAWYTVNPTNFDKSFTYRHLPEYRNRLVEGEIRSTRTAKGMKDVPLVLSYLGDEDLLTTSTDSLGGFALELKDARTMAFLRPLINDSLTWEIALKNDYLDSYSEYQYPDYVLDSLVVNSYKERSILNQIQNGMYVLPSVQSDYSADHTKSTFVDFDFSYQLDDYNRFPQLEEIFIEYIPSVSIRKKKQRKFFKVKDDSSWSGEALVLLDGIPVEGESMLKFSPYKIRSVSIKVNRVYMGEHSFDGVVSFTSFDGDLHSFDLRKNAYYQFETHESQDKFRIQASEKELTSAPLFIQSQLYWNPQKEVLSGDGLEFKLQTPAFEGVYEIRIEGLTDQGRPMSTTQPLIISHESHL